MVPVVWNAMGGAFGGSLPPLQPGDPLFGHLRYIGAHLIVGAAATESVQRRARESGAALNAWVRARLEPLQLAWRRPGVDQREHVARNAVGMLWVGHPATVQGGALVMQELLARRAVLRQLVLNIEWARGGRLSNPELREVVKNHVLELLRFRPPFPILRRDVVRDTLYGTDGAGRAGGGSQLTLLILGALFDPAAQLNASCKPSEYRPGRAFREADDRYLIFGVGARQCIARDQVIETLVSALICLLELPNLRWADPWWRRMRYDGPIVSSMRLAFDSR